MTVEVAAKSIMCIEDAARLAIMPIGQEDVAASRPPTDLVKGKQEVMVMEHSRMTVLLFL